MIVTLDKLKEAFMLWQEEEIAEGPWIRPADPVELSNRGAEYLLELLEKIS